MAQLILIKLNLRWHRKEAGQGLITLRTCSWSNASKPGQTLLTERLFFRNLLAFSEHAAFFLFSPHLRQLLSLVLAEVHSFLTHHDPSKQVSKPLLAFHVRARASPVEPLPSHPLYKHTNMSSINTRTGSSLTFALLLSLLPSSMALPTLQKREMATGAKAGMGIGIAVAAIIVVGVIAFLVVHFRRARHIKAINQERAVLAGEKNKDGSDKLDKFAPEPQPSGMPRRNKSVKDRLMGPLYRGSTIDMLPMPNRAKLAGQNSNRGSTATMDGAHWDNVDGQPFLHKPWAGGESSPRPSFSSKRATRMMMMM